MIELDFNIDKLTSDIQAKLSLTPQKMAKIQKAVGNTLISLSHDCFDQGVDPYGVVWQPLKWRQGEPLRDTGILRNSITWQPTYNGIVAGHSTKYGDYHQNGTGIYAGNQAYKITPKAKKALWFEGAGHPLKSVTIKGIPARRFFPVKKFGMPKTWADEIEQAIKDVLNKY